MLLQWNNLPLSAVLLSSAALTTILVFSDTGYPHDGRADKDSYPHDGRADKDSYPHDRHNQYTMLSLYIIMDIV